MTREIYYDNSATTRTREEAAKLVYEMLTDCYGNPSSLHRKGFAAQQRLEQARAQMAQALGCQPGEIYFTAGGTEADNLAILGAARRSSAQGRRLSLPPSSTMRCSTPSPSSRARGGRLSA